MITANFSFDEDGFRRKIMDAAENQVRDKLAMRGIHGVIVKAIRIEGDHVRFQFSGDAEAVKKAKEIFGS
jgi:hypothetical protein